MGDVSIDNDRVPATVNKNYKKNGIASYVWLLQKYNITPTKPGPYFRHHTEPHEKRELLEYPGLKSLRKHKHRHHHKTDPTDPDPETIESVTIDPEEPASAKALFSMATKGGTPVTAIDQQNDSMYLSPVMIGGQKVVLDFDTGSSDCWVMSTHLDDATEETLKEAGHNIYDPDASLEMAPMPGSTWQIEYGDGSNASGDVVTDTLTLGGTEIKGQAIECAQAMSEQFHNNSGDGLLGLAMGAINAVKPTRVKTPMENMIDQNTGGKNLPLFTCWLSSWRDGDEDDKGQSFYTFGYIDQEALKRCNATDFHWTPLVHQDIRGFWEFSSITYVINDKVYKRKSYQKGGNTAIADTGTTLALVEDSVCDAIYKCIPGAEYDSTNQGWVFPTNTPEEKLPSVGFALGNNEYIRVPKESLLFAETKAGTCYGGIQSRGDLPFDILGDTWLKGGYFCFNQGEKKIGAAQRTLHSQNLSAPR